MGLFQMGPPTELILKLKATFGIENFVETGTYQGETAEWAAQNFNQVFTIEYSEAVYSQTAAKLNKIQNIELIFGDSRKELQKLVEKLESSSFFWLDAHWSGGATYGSDDECPLLNEISIINHSGFDNFIFIDDARLFTSPPQPPHQVEQWPDITSVVNALQAGKHTRYIVIIEDVIIAVPSSAKSITAHYCQDKNAQFWEERSRSQKVASSEKNSWLIFQNVFDLASKARNRLHV